MTADPYRLQRFVDAQDRAGTYDQALAELRAGRKESHWMWFVFPQLAGLGRSPTARTYGIASLAEAHAYLGHPVLGPRLRESARALIAHSDRSAEEILGEIDAIKLRSSMTSSPAPHRTSRCSRRSSSSTTMAKPTGRPSDRSPT